MNGNGYAPPEDVAATAPFLRALSLADLDRMEFPPTRWVVDELIPAGALVLVVGRPKAGKSLLAVDLAASVALGDTFLDRATAHGAVALAPAEDAFSLVRDRLWTRLGAERAAPLYVIPADGSLDQSIRLDDPRSFEQLAALIGLLKPAVLILDPLRELHHRKENDADEMAALLRPLRQLAHETDTAIILIHHRNKHASDPTLATRGSSAITGGVDVVITLERSDEGDDDADDSLTPDQVLTLRVEGRYGPRKRLAARLGVGLRWHATTTRADDDLSAADRIRRHLEVTGEELTADELVEATGVAKRTVQNTLTELVKRPARVLRHGAGTKGDPYRYAAGRRRDESGTQDSAPSSQKLPIRPDAERYTPTPGGMSDEWEVIPR